MSHNNNNAEESTLSNYNDAEEVAPAFKEYSLHLKDGSIKVCRGYLAVAQSFVAVGTGSGDLQLVVPLTELSFCEEIPASAGHA
jgi:hypothetical protein